METAQNFLSSGQGIESSIRTDLGPPDPRQHHSSAGDGLYALQTGHTCPTTTAASGADMDDLILIEADVTKPTTTTAASGADMDDLIPIKADVTEARRTKPRLPLAPTWTTWILKPNKSEVLWFTLPVSKYKHNWAYDKGKVQRRTAALELYGTMLLFSLLVDFQQGLTPQQLHNPPHGVGIPPTAATGADMGATHKCATIIIHIPLMTTARAMPHGPQPRHKSGHVPRSGSLLIRMLAQCILNIISKPNVGLRDLSQRSKWYGFTALQPQTPRGVGGWFTNILEPNKSEVSWLAFPDSKRRTQLGLRQG